jgi:4-aminobutyrate aminotransferase-like enzyme
MIRDSLGGPPAAILIEPLQGTAGNLVPPGEWLPLVAAIAREHGALLIVDEMITGWGRTGRLFGAEHFGVEPDVITFGKGAGGGFPVSGLITRDEVVARADPWSRPSHSSSSFGGSPLACAAADAATRVIVEERLDARAAETGEALLGALRPLAEKYPFVGEVRGRGLFLAVELVADRHTRAPLPRDACEKIFRHALARGLLTMAYSPRVRINPPLVITREQALEGAALFDEALGAFARERA